VRNLYKLQQSSNGLVDLLLSSEDWSEFLATLTYLDRIQARNMDELKVLADMNAELQQERDTLSARHAKASQEADRALQEQEETEVEVPQPEAKTEKKKSGILVKVGKAILTAITSTLAAMLGTYVSDKVTGKKTKSRTSAKGRVVKNATSAATRTITKELTRDILGNLIK
jgi:hypothetical protein